MSKTFNPLRRYVFAFLFILLFSSVVSSVKFEVIEKEKLKKELTEPEPWGRIVIFDGPADFKKYKDEQKSFLLSLIQKGRLVPILIESKPPGVTIHLDNGLFNSPRLGQTQHLADDQDYRGLLGFFVTVGQPQRASQSYFGGYRLYDEVPVRATLKGFKEQKHVFTSTQIDNIIEDYKKDSADVKTYLKHTFRFTPEREKKVSQVPLSSKPIASRGSATTSTSRSVELSSSSAASAESSKASDQLAFAEPSDQSDGADEFEAVSRPVRGRDGRLYIAYRHWIPEKQTLDGEAVDLTYESFGIAVLEEEKNVWQSLGVIDDVARYQKVPTVGTETAGVKTERKLIIAEHYDYALGRIIPAQYETVTKAILRCKTELKETQPGNRFYALEPHPTQEGVIAYYGRSSLTHTTRGVCTVSEKPGPDKRLIEEEYGYDYNNVLSVPASAKNGLGTARTEATKQADLEFIGSSRGTLYFRLGGSGRYFKQDYQWQKGRGQKKSTYTYYEEGDFVPGKITETTKEQYKGDMFSVPAGKASGKLSSTLRAIDNPFGGFLSFESSSLFIQYPDSSIKSTGYDSRKGTSLVRVRGNQVTELAQFGAGGFYGYGVTAVFDQKGNLHAAMYGNTKGVSKIYYQFVPRHTFIEDYYPKYQKVYVFHTKGTVCRVCDFLKKYNVRGLEINPDLSSVPEHVAAKVKSTGIAFEQGESFVYVDNPPNPAASANPDYEFHGAYPNPIALAKVLGITLDPLPVADASGLQLFTVYMDSDGLPQVALTRPTPDEKQEMRLYAYEAEKFEKDKEWNVGRIFSFKGHYPVLRGFPPPANENDLEFLVATGSYNKLITVQGSKGKLYKSAVKQELVSARTPEENSDHAVELGVQEQSEANSDSPLQLEGTDKINVELSSTPTLNYFDDKCPDNKLSSGSACMQNGLLHINARKGATVNVGVSGTEGQLRQFKLGDLQLPETSRLYVRFTLTRFGKSDSDHGNGPGELVLLFEGQKDKKRAKLSRTFGDLTLASDNLLESFDLESMDGETYEAASGRFRGLSRTAFLIMQRKADNGGALSANEWQFMAEELKSTHKITGYDVSRIMLWKLVYEKVPASDFTVVDRYIGQKPDDLADKMATVFAYMPSGLEGRLKVDLTSFYADIVLRQSAESHRDANGIPAIYEKWNELGYGFGKYETSSVFSYQYLGAYFSARKRAPVMSRALWLLELRSDSSSEWLAGVLHGVNIYEQLRKKPFLSDALSTYEDQDGNVLKYGDSKDFLAVTERALQQGRARLGSLGGGSGDLFAMSSADSTVTGATQGTNPPT